MIELIIAIVYATILITIMLIDFKRHIIPDLIVYPSMCLVITCSLTWGYWMSSVAGGLIGLAFMIVLYLYSKGTMGLGDVKLGLLCGLMVGYLWVMPALLLGVIACWLIAVLLTKKGKGRLEALPLGTFLALATLPFLGGRI